MQTHFKLDDLFTHLIARCSGPLGRAAAQRWQAVEPALADITDPPEALALCGDRCDRPRSNEALGALVRLGADDELAALSALVALLPGLGAIAARLRRCSSLDPDNLEADLASAAWEVIRFMGTEDIEWPAALIVSRASDRVRSSIRSDARSSAVEARTCELDAFPTTSGRPVVESLGEVWHSNPDAREAVALVFATRVWGTPTAEWAEQCGLDVRAARTRRARAQRRVLGLAQHCVITTSLTEQGRAGGGR